MHSISECEQHGITRQSKTTAGIETKGSGISRPNQSKAVCKASKPVRLCKAVKEPCKGGKTCKRATPNLNNAGLPEGYEIATKTARFLAWLMNFVWNFGVLSAALFVSVAGSTPTIPAIAALLMIITNVFVIPIMTGRTLGNFISRTRYITANEAKPNPVHGFLVNSTGLMGLTGFGLVVFFMGRLFDDAGKLLPVSLIFLIIGLVLVVVRIVDGRFKSNSDQSQGLYDMLFGAYLVKYVPQEGEELSGIALRLESMANFGDSFQKRQENAAKKRAVKKEATLAESAASDDVSKDDTKSKNDKKKDASKEDSPK